MRRPPRLAERLLRAALPDDLRGQTIAGDLLQEFDERGRRHGAISQWLWYWIQALELSLRYVIRRRRQLGAASHRGPESGRPGARFDPSIVPPAKLTREEAMENLWTDLRYGVRMLFRTPTLSIVSILTIGLGVGLVTFTFSALYGAVLRDIPVRDPDRIVSLHATLLERGIDQMSMPMADFVAFRDQATSFEGLAAGYQGTVNIAGDEGAPERFDGAFLTANGLGLLGVPPHLGRTHRDGEDVPGVEGTIVLGYDVWRNRFGGDDSVIGRTVRANGESMTIIGVMPPGFRFPFDQEIWLAYRQDWEALPRRGGNMFEVYAYLQEGVSIETATEEVQMIADRLAAEFPDTNEGIGARLQPYKEAYMPAEITAIMWLMLGATVGVMLIACANVANLLLARAALRARDVAIRTALGANRSRVIRQLLTEALVLGVLGGMVGLVLAYVSTEMFNAAVLDIEKPYWIDMRTDGPALIFTVGVTLLAAMAAGTIPALRSSGAGVGTVLNDESRGSSSLRLGRMSGVLVIGELALSCGLLICAGFMVMSVINSQQMSVNLDPDNLMTARVGLFETDYPAQGERQRFFRDLLARLNEEPGIASATLTTSLPSAGAGGWQFALEGESYETNADYPRTLGTQIAAGFFETMGTEMIAGREFRFAESFWSSETEAEIEPVTIVNQSFVDKFLPNSDPLGKRVRIGTSESTEPWLRIVGVVPDLYIGGGVGGIGDVQSPELMYVTAGYFDVRFMSVAVRSQAAPDALAGQIRGAVASLDANLPIYWVFPMSMVLADNSWAFTLFGSLFTIFGAAALFLAAVGLYGVMSFSVAQRRQEMGVRMALGAETRDILGIVFRRVAAQLAIGLTLGLAIGYGLAQPLSFVMFGIETTNLAVYVMVVLTLIGTGLLATFFPAHRATRVDPVTALRPD